MSGIPLRSVCSDHSRYVKGCTGCAHVSAERYRRRSRLMAYGQWRGSVDAGPATAHVVALIKSGLSRQAIARKAGLSPSVIDRVAANRSERIHARSADAILAVQAVPEPASKVSSLGTARRLQALMAAGWDSHALAVRLDVAYQQVSKWRYRYQAHVPYRIHQQVACLYRELECRPGPSERAQRLARVHGYVPPILWDDDGDIDNPQARPKGRVLEFTPTPHDREKAAA